MSNRASQYFFKLPFDDTNLTASASTDSVTSNGVEVGRMKGSLTMFLELTKASGTVTDLTIEAQVKGENSTDWAGSESSEWLTVGTVATAYADTSPELYISLSGLSWWSWFKEIRFRISAASGTFNVDFVCSIEGQ